MAAPRAVKAADKKAASIRKIPIRREISAGGVIWRRDPVSSKFQAVLVKPAGRQAWVLPKGHIESGESVSDAAVREAAEETGLEVRLGEPLGAEPAAPGEAPEQRVGAKQVLGAKVPYRSSWRHAIAPGLAPRL